MEFHCLRLTPGQEVKGALVEYVKAKSLKSAFIVTCCGSVRRATIRFAEKSDGSEKKVKMFGDIGERTFETYLTQFFHILRWRLWIAISKYVPLLGLFPQTEGHTFIQC